MQAAKTVHIKQARHEKGCQGNLSVFRNCIPLAIDNARVQKYSLWFDSLVMTILIPSKQVDLCWDLSLCEK